ncbi:NADPH-dependent glutamate synthase, NADPH oxidoreductase subunit [Geotalea daltonii FRC-32]|uniref:NADPH-dependent glutamate synthase, NADPH oxidoreductase subunit n=1 Tax=Geotalea daltonii (strain DSM 22248 / JCM 15807 / FRC-32) TaxID=316067 RepID=B9M4T6_GEODF|nr:FAD-dependent oxidoreductase [Geotalea daltonii]ACM21620.1 NADPH-dependent glutamate synthase, NADPH oxidoreductase subunit [Geotalea daltonii FRC-32]
MNYVIIGNSVAAVGAIRGIRNHDANGTITVLSRENRIAYGRPLISYLLGGTITDKKMAYLPEDFYEKNQANIRLGAEVVAVDSGKKQVKLAGGETIPFDKLLIATGGDPFVPPIDGLQGKEKIFTFTTWDDAAKLKALSYDIRRVVVIGGGLIGLKAAEGLYQLDKKVTIVELADRILSAAFDRTAGRIVAKKMKANGIDVITEDTVVKIEGEGRDITGVTLKSGDFIPCDTVIVAIGVRPAASFLKGSGIEVNRGVIVDDRMETSVKGIFAAGDVAEASDFFSKSKNPMPIWPDAYIQGDVAGAAMTGSEKGYVGGLAMNSIELFKVPTISMGITNPQDEKEFEILTYLDQENYQYRKIVLKDNILVGAVLVGAVDRAGIFAGLVREKIDVAPFKDKLLAVDFGFAHLTREIRSTLFAPQGKVA